MHGCKNVPSTTGLCEIKARAPFPHNAMLSTGRPHDGAKKKPPAKKHVSFCSTLHCGGTGRGLLFRTNRSKKKRVPCFLQHFVFFRACPADAPWDSFSDFVLAPVGDGGGCCRSIPPPSHSPSGGVRPFVCILLGQENGVGGWQMPSTGVEYYRTYENCENR